MFTRHLIAMGLVVIGFMIGAILAVTESWQTGLIVGVVVCGCGFLLALVNMAIAMRGM